MAKGRKAQPTAAIVDSQSARTAEAGGPRGCDGSKKVSGRKPARSALPNVLGTSWWTRKATC